MNTNATSHNILISSDEYLINWSRYFTAPEHVNRISFFNEKTHRINEKNLSSRVINHWEGLGLIKAERTENAGWRKFSIMDIIWIQLMRTLRQFGLPLESIKLIRDKLTEKKINGSEYPDLEFTIVQALVTRAQVFLLYFPVGEVILSGQEDYEQSLTLGTLAPTHLRVSLNPIVAMLFPKHSTLSVEKSKITLTAVEMELLLLIRTGEFQSIRIKQEKGEIELIEATQKIPADMRVEEVLRSGKYQEITLVQKGGKVTHLKRTVSIKPTKTGKSPENLE